MELDQNKPRIFQIIKPSLVSWCIQSWPKSMGGGQTPHENVSACEQKQIAVVLVDIDSGSQRCRPAYRFDLFQSQPMACVKNVRAFVFLSESLPQIVHILGGILLVLVERSQSSNRRRQPVCNSPAGGHDSLARLLSTHR